MPEPREGAGTPLAATPLIVGVSRTLANASPPIAYRFSFGPWNISTGADPFGPPVPMFLRLVDIVRETDEARVEEFRANR